MRNRLGIAEAAWEDEALHGMARGAWPNISHAQCSAHLLGDELLPVISATVEPLRVRAGVGPTNDTRPLGEGLLAAALPWREGGGDSCDGCALRGEGASALSEENDAAGGGAATAADVLAEERKGERAAAEREV
jgi:hypothetical protein